MAEEKPGQFLHIPDSLGRDIDKGLQPPIEAFLPDHVLQETQDATASAVHAEALRPISKAEAARRTTFDGKTLPNLPSTRRVIPAPYRRDRVVGGSHGKTWGYVRADQVLAGDIIPEFGLVAEAGAKVRYRPLHELLDVADWKSVSAAKLKEPVAVGSTVVLTNPQGVTRNLDAGTQVRVFRVFT